MGSHCVTTCRLLLILLILDAVMCDIQEFFANLPSDVGNSVNNAWNYIIKAIKRPVRIRRLGRTGKTKTNNSPVTKPIVIISLKGEEISTTTNLPLSTARSAKLVIPVLATPHWESILDYKRQRVGSNGLQNKLYIYRYIYERSSDRRIASEKGHIAPFGNLFYT